MKAQRHHVHCHSVRILLACVNCQCGFAGSSAGAPEQKAPVCKAKWQDEIWAYTAHLHLTDGEMDMSADLGCAARLHPHKCHPMLDPLFCL